MSTQDIFTGIGLIVGLAVACQVVAARLKLPAIILLLPTGFAAGAITSDVNPDAILGEAFSPLVGLAVAVILFDGGLDLRFADLEGRHQRVVRRLLAWGIPLTWLGATVLAAWLLGLPAKAATMLGAILIVSGPTVVGPLLAFARPVRHVRAILGWEGSTIDPIGAVIAALTFAALNDPTGPHLAAQVVGFGGSVALGLAGAAVGTAVLWLALRALALRGVLATEAIVATVVLVAALCNAVRDDSGLIAAIGMGVALANLRGMGVPEDRAFLETTVQLVIGILFVSIAATVTPASLDGLVLPCLGLVAGLVLVVRPLVAWVATAGSGLPARQRAFIGWMDPRGIVAASTAATFSAPLVAAGVAGADQLLPATFLVIVGTVAVYGLTAAPVARALGVVEPDEHPDQRATPQPTG